MHGYLGNLIMHQLYIATHKSEQLGSLKSGNLVVREQAAPLLNPFADGIDAVEVSGDVGDFIVVKSYLIQYLHFCQALWQFFDFVVCKFEHAQGLQI